MSKRSRLNMLTPRLTSADVSRRPMAQSLSEKRMTGRRLQQRRLNVWARDPHCARCGKVTIYPHGFELDHRVPLYQGGADVEENCQVLCIGPGPGDGCHALKTAEDAGRVSRA